LSTPYIIGKMFTAQINTNEMGLLHALIEEQGLDILVISHESLSLIS